MDSEFDMQSVEQSLKGVDFSVGSVVEGQIIAVDKDYVYIDLPDHPTKSDILIRLSEFLENPPVIGQNIQAMVQQMEPLMLSVAQLKKQQFMDHLIKAYEQKEPVSGTIVDVKDKGYHVDLSHHVHGFLPFSLSALGGDKLAHKGKKFDFYIHSSPQLEKSILLDRKSLYQQKANENVQQLFDQVQVGQKLTGIIDSHVSFGYFVKISEYFSALLPYGQLSWSTEKNDLKVGQTLDVWVNSIDIEHKKMSVTMRDEAQLWLEFLQAFHKHTNEDNFILSAKVVKVLPTGCILRLENDLNAFLHVSEISWDYVKDIQSTIVEGDLIQVKVMRVDEEKNKIFVSLRQLLPNSWDQIEQDYPIGKVIDVTLVEKLNKSLKVKVADDIYGYIPFVQLNWNYHKNKEELDRMEMGQTIKAMVYQVDKKKKFIGLSVKQIQGNPWDQLANIHLNSCMEVTIKAKTERGLKVEVFDDLEGFIPLSQIAYHPDKRFDINDLDLYPLGTKVKAVLIKKDIPKQNLVFSINKKDQQQNQQETAHFFELEQISTFTPQFDWEEKGKL